MTPYSEKRLVMFGTGLAKGVLVLCAHLIMVQFPMVVGAKGNQIRGSVDLVNQCALRVICNRNEVADVHLLQVPANPTALPHSEAFELPASKIPDTSVCLIGSCGFGFPEGYGSSLRFSSLFLALPAIGAIGPIRPNRRPTELAFAGTCSFGHAPVVESSRTRPGTEEPSRLASLLLRRDSVDRGLACATTGVGFGHVSPLPPKQVKG